MSRRKLVVGTGLLASYNSAAKVDIPFNNIAEESGKVGGTDYSDTLMQWKYTFIFANSMLGVFLMLLELQVAWDGAKLQWTRSARTLRFLISFLTIVLVIQLVDYYNGLLAAMTKHWKHSHVNSSFNISTWGVARSSPLGRMMWAEIIICLFHAPPVHWIDDKWGLVMFLRFYMLFRILRDRSTIYKKRITIMRKYAKYGIRHWGPPKFDWFLSLKSVFLQRPVPALSLATAWTLWVCGHCIYVYERELDPVTFNYLGSLYLAMISMITGWPTDTYEQFWPNTRMGRAACIMSTLLGLFLLSMILEVFSSWFVATPHQRPALVWAHRQDIKMELRDAAARIIQIVWRRHALSTLKPSALRVGRQSRKCGETLLRGSLGTRYVAAVKSFRRLMRQKVSLHINFVESQKTQLAGDQNESDYDDPEDGGSYDSGRTDVDERLKAMEKLIQSLTQKIDTLVASNSNINNSNNHFNYSPVL